MNRSEKQWIMPPRVVHGQGPVRRPVRRALHKGYGLICFSRPPRTKFPIVPRPGASTLRLRSGLSDRRRSRLCSPPGRALIDRALYLPGRWAVDRGRRAKAGVPAAVAFTKPRLGRAMLARAFAAVVPCAWVTGDKCLRRRLRAAPLDREARAWLCIGGDPRPAARFQASRELARGRAGRHMAALERRRWRQRTTAL